MNFTRSFSRSYLAVVACVLFAVYTGTASAQNALITVRDGDSRATTNIHKGAIPASKWQKPREALPGDVSGDGNRSMYDAALIRNHLLQRDLLTGDALARADADQDGNVTLADVVYVNTHISPGILLDGAIFVDDTANLTCTSVDLPTIVLEWTGGGSPPVSVGNFVYGSEPVGFLREVTAIDQQGNVLTLTTEFASMAEFTQNGQFATTQVLDGAQPTAKAIAEGGAKYFVRGGAGATWSLTGKEIYSDANLTVDIPYGTINFDPEIDFEHTIEGWSLKYLRFGAEGALTTDIDIRAVAQISGNWSTGDITIPGLEVHKPFLAGYVAGYVTARIVARVDVSGTGSAEATTGFNGGLSLGYQKAYYGDRWHTDRSGEFTVTGEPLVFEQVQGDVTVRVTLAPQLEIIFYAVVGPTLSVEPYLSLDAAAQAAARWYATWALYAGVDLVFGIDFGILDFAIDPITFPAWHVWGPREILSGTYRPPGGEEITLSLPGGVPLVLKRIPSGSFQMGRYSGEQDSESDEDPQHLVTIAYQFYMGKYEVTKAQWEAVMGTTPWSGLSYVLNDPDSPAVCVSWNDAQSFITALNSHLASSGQGSYSVRLPSESEWEYSARAGTTTRFYWGDDPSYTQIGDYAWYDGNAWDANEKYAHVVGQKQPNAWGLYDMSGNVWEWCQDWYHSSYSGAPSDGSAWESPTGSSRVLRGGSWSYDARLCRSANRFGLNPYYRHYCGGFRVVLVSGGL